MEYQNTDFDPAFNPEYDPDEPAFLRQEPVSRDAMAAAAWLLFVGLCVLAALTVLACRQ